jgi:hypothetical protein
MKIGLVLNALDEGLDPSREFRVFVPPPPVRDAKEEVGQMRGSAVVRLVSIDGPSHSHTTNFPLNTRRSWCANGLLESIQVFMDKKTSQEVGGPTFYR